MFTIIDSLECIVDLVYGSHSPDGADFPGVVDESDVSLGGSVAFTDAHVPEAPQEFLPRLRAYAVPQSQTHTVITVTLALHTHTHGLNCLKNQRPSFGSVCFQ